MIKCHPSIDDSNFDIEIARAIKNADLIGYISIPTLKQLFNLFSWVYVENRTNGAFEKNEKLEKFLSRFDLFRFKGDSICYSAVLFYQKLSKIIDMRELELSNICTTELGSNKLFSSASFTYTELYDLYRSNAGELSTDFLLFNTLFKKSVERDVKKMTHYGEITKITQVSELVRPDLPYKLALNKLNVNYDREEEREEKKKLYILQDSTYSMERYLSQLKMLKGFILNSAFENDYEVEWLYVSDRINGRTTYKKENIASLEFEFIFSGISVDTSSILTMDEFFNKQVVIITDGTDSFNFKFNTKTTKINMISFIENIKLKDKISNYGLFFTAFRG